MSGDLLFALPLRWRLPHALVSRTLALTRVDMPPSMVKRENLIATGGRFALLSLGVGKVGEWEKRRNLIETG